MIPPSNPAWQDRKHFHIGGDRCRVCLPSRCDPLVVDGPLIFLWGTPHSPSRHRNWFGNRGVVRAHLGRPSLGSFTERSHLLFLVGRGGDVPTLAEPKPQVLGPSLPPVGESPPGSRARLGHSSVSRGGRRAPLTAPVPGPSRA